MKRIIVIVSIVLIVLFCFIFFKFKNIDMNKQENIVLETVNLEDGLQKEELESLRVEDYNKFSMQDVEDLELDEVDNYYYMKMWDSGGVFKENATREEREKIYLFYNNPKEAILEMCKKNGNWRLITYFEEFGEYNQKDGLLKGFDYTKIEAIDYVEENEGDYVDILAKNENEERTYRINIGIEDGIIQSINVKLGEIESLNTNNEIELNKLKFDKEHIEENFNNLCKYESAYIGGLDWYRDDIGITNNFYEKYPYFIDIFIHYSPLEYNKITLKDLDIDNQIATFEVDSILECKRRTYEVKYVLDNNLYLDDVDVKLTKEEVVDLGKPNKQSAYYIFQNSNWSKLPISDNFKKKFSSEKGVFYPLKILQYKIDYTMKDNKYVYIYEFILKDKEKVFYSSVEEFDNKKMIDDVINEKLPYDSSMTLEEVRDAYIKDYVEKD